ncbi:hypothetical protein U3516DRAFT_785683 [Neocallimastix sp. 'constans']
MHITEFEKLNYNYIIQELALKNDYCSQSRKSSLNLEEYNINKKIKLEPLLKNDISLDDNEQSQSVGKNNETDLVDQDHIKINNKSFQAVYGNLNKYKGYNKNTSNQNNKNEKFTNTGINEVKESNEEELSCNKNCNNKISDNMNLDVSESDEELYDINDEEDNKVNESNDQIDIKSNDNEEQDNNIFRRGQQKFISSPNYGTKNMNRLYHLLNSVSPLYKFDSAMKKSSEITENIENQYFLNNGSINNKQKKNKVLRFDDDDKNSNKYESDIDESPQNYLNPYLDNYVEISCKLLNSRIRLGKPIPIELEIINKGSKSIPYLKFEVCATTNNVDNENNESFCDKKIMFAYFLEAGKKCIKKFSLEPYLWNNEEDNFYDNIKNLNINTVMGSNTLYSTSNLSNTKSNIITNKNFSSYYYYSKMYARYKNAKASEKGKAFLSRNKSLNSLTNIFDLGIAADKDDYDEYRNEINYNTLRVIPKEAKIMLKNLPSSIKINIYKENGELLLCNNSEFTLKSEYFTQDFYLLGQYFKLNSEDESAKGKTSKYKKYRKNKSYSLNILLVNSSIEAKNKFIHSIEYALFVEKQLLSKNSVNEFRDLLVDDTSMEYYKDNSSKFYWNNNKEYYQEIKMANHFPKNIKFYDCPCNDRIDDIKKDMPSKNNHGHDKNYNTFTKMNSLFKNKFNILSTISSENEINTSSNNIIDQKVSSTNEEQYCCWFDGDEAELISNGELPLGKKILGEKICYNDIEEDFYNDTIKKNPIHNIVYLFSQKQIENIKTIDKENIDNNINKLLKLKKGLNICIIMDNCNIINTEYQNINEYIESLKLKCSTLFNIDKENIFVIPYCIDRKIDYENNTDFNKLNNTNINDNMIKKENQEYLNFLNIEFLYLLMLKAEDEYSKLCLK